MNSMCSSLAILRSAGSAIAAVALASCGGGGSSPTPAPSPVNRAPSLTASTTSVSVVENTSGTIATVQVSDPDGDPVTLSLSGDDAGFFTLGSGGALSFSSSPNFDAYSDSNADNDYIVIVQASDGRGGSASRTITVRVSNDREGVAVTRIATGFNDPVGMSLLFGRTLLVAERTGRIRSVNGRDGTLADYKSVTLPAGGEVLDIASETIGSLPLLPAVLFRSPAGITLRFNINVDDPRDIVVASGDPDGAGGKIAYSLRNGYEDYGFVLVAIGDPSGTRAAGSGGYGKISYVTPPDTVGDMAIFPIGKGIRQAGGWLDLGGGAFLADQGGSTAHEINSIQRNWPIDFGWPYFEGSVRQLSGGPTNSVAPVFSYPLGDGSLNGSGIVAGALYVGDVASVNNLAVFGDVSGKIWSVAGNFSPGSFENRTADFTPDAGTIDEVVKIIVDDSNVLYILDADGDLFRLDHD